MSFTEPRGRSALFQYVSIGALAFTAFAAPVAAQVNEETEVEEEARQDTVIVTGVATETSKQDATFTINTFNANEIRELAPISTADLLQNVPGIYAEGSTAGEASNNITVRGLPVTGGYRYAPQLLDGLPWFEEPEVPFMNNDVAVRADLMTEQVEVVKGGPGGILYSNGLGATVNHITRTGGQDFEGAYKLEVADYNFLRNDLYVSGPINDNLTFAVGGFYRTSDGLRDAGYTADQGGQIRANLLYTSDDGSMEVFGQYHKISDKTAFYQNVPFQVPAFTQRGTAENPIEIDPDQVFELGLDFQDGTAASPFTRRWEQVAEDGVRQIDLADGINPEFDIFTARLKKDFDNGWGFDAGLRVTDGTSGFNSAFMGNDTTTADRFLEARYRNDVLAPAYGAAQRAVADPTQCDVAELAGWIAPGVCPMGLMGVTQSDFQQNIFIPQSVGAFYRDDGSRVADTALLNFLVPFITNTEAESSSFDARLTKSVDFYGTHDFTFGAYVSDSGINQDFQASLLVAEMADTSRLVDLLALDASGNPVGPSITRDSAIISGWFGNVNSVDTQNTAFYLLDHWELMDSRLKLDIGVRYQEVDATVEKRTRQFTAGLSDQTPANVVPGSTADTLADNDVEFPGPRQTLDDSFDGFGWSIGGNYSVTPDFAVYALISDSFRLPSYEDYINFSVDSSQPGDQVESIMQYEGGVRYYADTWDTQVAVFYNEFSPRQQTNMYRDFTAASCVTNGSLVDINTCPEVTEFFERGVQNVGIEVEASWRPSFVKGLELGGNFVIQDPEITDANFTLVREVRTNNVITGYAFDQTGEDGRRPRRLSTEMVNFHGSWDTKPYTGVPFKPYFRYTYFGDRFSESRDVDVTLYPEYFHIDGGFIWDFNEDLAFQFHVANITNELSFTEGDPLFVDLKGPNGATNRGVARPLFGRTMRAMLTYRF